MDEKPKTFRQDPATGEWEQVPEREPIVASWDALWIFAVSVGAAFAASVLLRLLLWN